MDLLNFFHCIVLPKKSWARLVEFCYSSPLKVNFVSLNPSNQHESTYQHSKASKLGIFSNAYLICGHGDNGHVKTSLKAKSDIGRIVTKEVCPTEWNQELLGS